MVKKSLVILLVIVFVLSAGFYSDSRACPNDRKCCYSTYHDGACAVVKRISDTEAGGRPRPKAEAKVVNNITFVPACGCRCGYCCAGGHCHKSACRLRNDVCRPMLLMPCGPEATNNHLSYKACCNHAPCCADCGGISHKFVPRNQHDCGEDFWCSQHRHRCHGNGCVDNCCGCITNQVIFHDDCTGEHTTIPTHPLKDRLIIIK